MPVTVCREACEEAPGCLKVKVLRDEDFVDVQTRIIKQICMMCKIHSMRLNHCSVTLNVWCGCMRTC